MEASESLPGETLTIFKDAKSYQESGRFLEAMQLYQKGLVRLLKAKNDPLCSERLRSEIKDQSQSLIQSLNSCISNQATIFDLETPIISSPSTKGQQNPPPSQESPVMNSMSDPLKTHPSPRDNISLMQQRPIRIKNPSCSMNHKHIFLSESFLTISAAYQFMIDSGLRTLYGTRSSNSVSAHYVCRHNGGTNDPECTYKSKRKKKTEDSLCGGSIRISTKLISRTGVQRVFMVKGCLSHDHDISDSRLSPYILKLMENGEGKIVSTHFEIYFPSSSSSPEGDTAMISGAPNYIQEITLDESAEDELHALLLPCHKCSRVFFSKPSFEEHDCHLFRDPEGMCSLSHDHVFLQSAPAAAQGFDSFQDALEYVRSQGLHESFLEQFKRKDFIVYQCSKGVLPDETHLRNKECPAHFTIKSSGGSKVVVVGCIEHSHGVVDKSRNGKDYRAKEENG